MHKRNFDAMREADDLHKSGHTEKAIDRYAELILGSARHTPVVAFKSNTMMAKHWSSQGDAKEAKAYIVGAEIAYSSCKIAQDSGMPENEALSIIKEMRAILDSVTASPREAGKDKDAGAKDDDEVDLDTDSDNLDEYDDDSQFDFTAVFEDDDDEPASFAEYQFTVGYLREALKAERAESQELEVVVADLVRRLRDLGSLVSQAVEEAKEKTS